MPYNEELGWVLEKHVRKRRTSRLKGKARHGV